MKKALFTLFAFLVILSAKAQKQDTTVYNGCRLIGDTTRYIGDKQQVLFDSCPQFGQQPGDYDLYIKTYLKRHGISQKKRAGVVISVIIEKDGNIAHAQIIHPGSSKFLNKIALKAVYDMPKWKPAILHGKPVRMSYFLAVR
ncbi:MAG TPA: energy transducer TonB [Mucilaginibacter sp.]|nr:energy transducer TonB [Mucilaginibacter sp.]